MKVSLTAHAKSRLKTRTSGNVSPADVVSEFSKGFFVRYAQDKKKHHCYHYAFSFSGYSEPFVVVLDENTNEIITLMNYDKCRYVVPANIMKQLEDKKYGLEGGLISLEKSNFIRVFLRKGEDVFEDPVNYILFTAMLLTIFNADVVKRGAILGKEPKYYKEKTKDLSSDIRYVLGLYFMSNTKAIRGAVVNVLGVKKGKINKINEWIENGDFYKNDKEKFKDLVAINSIFLSAYMTIDSLYDFEDIFLKIKEDNPFNGNVLLRLKWFFEIKDNVEKYKKNYSGLGFGAFYAHIENLFKNKYVGCLYNYGFLK